MSHVLVVYTDDEPGVLTRVASLFRRRGFNIHSLTVVDIAEDTLVIECTGSLGKIEALVDTLRPFGIIELGRTGAVAMARGTPTARKASVAPLRTGTSPESMSV